MASKEADFSEVFKGFNTEGASITRREFFKLGLVVSALLALDSALSGCSQVSQEQPPSSPTLSPLPPNQTETPTSTPLLTPTENFTSEIFSLPTLEPGSPRPNIEKGVERPIGGSGEVVKINANDLSQAIGKMGKDWTIFTTQDEKGKPIIPLILFPDGTPTLGVGPTDFEWNSDLQLWQKQKPEGQTEIVIPEIITPGGWNEKNQKAGPTLFTSAAFLFRENDSYRVGILYKPETLAEAKKQGIKLKRLTTINAPGNPYHGYGLLTGVEKNITLTADQQLTREENRNLRLKNQDGSYYQRIVYWDNVKNPNQLHQTEAFAGPFEKQPTIPYPSDELASQLAVVDYSVIKQEEEKEEYVAVAQVTDSQGESKSLIVAQAVLQKDKDDKETWVWQKTVPLALETNLVVPDPRITNPELFDLENPNSSIFPFVKAMKMAGIEVNPQEVVDNLEFRQIEGKDGKKYVVAYSKNTGDEFSDNTPILIFTNNRWEIFFPKIANDLYNSTIGVMFTGWFARDPSYMGSKYMQIPQERFSFTTSPDLAWQTNIENGRFNLRPNMGKFNFYIPDYALRYAENGNIKINMGAILSSFDNEYPEWIKNVTTREKLFEIVDYHIEGVMNHYKGKVSTYILINEFFGNPFINQRGYSFWLDKITSLGISQEEFITHIFNTAKKIDPNSILIFNEYGMEIAGSTTYSPEKDTKIYNLLTNVLKQNAPIDGIGFQMHLYAKDFRTDKKFDEKIQTLKNQIKKYRELGLDIYITELDIRLNEGLSDLTPEERYKLQGKIYQAIIKVAIEEGVKQINIWGVSDRDSWLERPEIGGPNASQADPLLFDNNDDPKPAYYGVLKGLTP
jgi:endo-1,4-beta-xylanase